MNEGLTAEKASILQAAAAAATRLDIPVAELLQDLARDQQRAGVRRGGQLVEQIEEAAAALLTPSPQDQHIDVTSRIDIAHVMRLMTHVDQAALLLGIAFAQGGVEDFRPAKRKGLTPSEHTSADWYEAIVNATLNRLHDVREALGHRWTPSVGLEPLVQAAFLLLADLTPVRAQLEQLARRDRRRAFETLREHLDILREQFLLTVELVADIEARPAPTTPEVTRFEEVRDDVLERAGQSLSLTEAAARLGVSRQALHQRIKKGTAIGVMRGRDIVVPAVQLVGTDGSETVVPRLQEVLQPFLENDAGTLPALQFLIEHDPSLGTTPLEALKTGDARGARRAALAYLNIEGG